MSIYQRALNPRRWCGGWGRKPPGYPIRASDGMLVFQYRLTRGFRQDALLPSATCTLHPATTRSKEEPEDQAQQGQQHHCDDPNQLLLVRSRALENIDNCPDISDQYQEAQEAAKSEVHHFSSFSV